ncbi:DUF3291 domain-containing protein [Flavimaricola marinus]|uniref:DUF3291 domain-containing protein n=1 Tax=Flavimaricola marinus TaxID=1819565 RepID=A0A238LE20_9RHOB|nr:DUF3291 domain-containing protein [Flavimaricola marinus]SMY07793.1 hypothetical protein LOM8899_01933 [Flavimaricola marinus]
MQHPVGHHLAVLNFGTLRYDWDDPRVAPFREALETVNAIGRRSPGFVWMLDESQMDAAQTDAAGPFGDNPRTASTLSVWTDAASLMAFVHKTLHAKILARGAEWFEPDDRSHVVLWFVPEGHRPTVQEGMDRFRLWQRRGDCPEAFHPAFLSRA